MKIRLVNNFLSCHGYILADFSLMKVVKRLDEWKNVDVDNLQCHCYEASQLHQSIKSHGMMNDEAQNKLVEIKQQIDELVEPQKALENDIKMKRGALHVVKKLLRQLEKNV
jgi:hypothetical protein